MQKILVAGGTGLVGSNLITKLKQKNFKIVLLTTQKNKANNKDIFYWQPNQKILPDEALIGLDACINLCGAGIFEKRFTDDRKKELIDSRIVPADFLYQIFKEKNIQLKHYIGASATGYYANICSDKLTENSTKGTGFISDLVEKWEGTAHRFESAGTKVCILRTGIVFSEKGGFLKQLALPIKYFAGALPGNGEQMISWIHIDDLSDIIIWMIENNLNGTFNAAASEPEKLGLLTKHIAKVLHRPLFLPNIPVFILKILFGERYQLLLTSQYVSNEKIKQTGFKFKYETPEIAIQDLLKG